MKSHKKLGVFPKEERDQGYERFKSMSLVEGSNNNAYPGKYDYKAAIQDRKIYGMCGLKNPRDIFKAPNPSS